MRLVLAILGLSVVGALAASCSLNEQSCDKNPELTCFNGGNSGNNTTTSNNRTNNNKS